MTMNLQTETQANQELQVPIRSNEVDSFGARQTSKQPQEESALQLSYELQASLECDAIIKHFAEGISSYVKFDGISYINAPANIDLAFGHPNVHRYTCELEVDHNSLGEVIISRATPFSKKEVILIEDLLCILVYPLRNALRYQAALQAAHKDPLTGIGNRREFDEQLQKELVLAKRHDSAFSLVIFDLDHFKQINDTYGHAAGDCVLKDVTYHASCCTRDTDTLYRIGGEEFALILRNSDAFGAKLLAERIRRRIADLVCSIAGTDVQVTTSLGIATATADDNSASLYERADQALYEAKRTGRNCSRVAA